MRFKPFLLSLCLATLCCIPPLHAQAATSDSESALNSVFSLLLSGSNFLAPQNVKVKVSGLSDDSLTFILNGKEEITIAADGTTSFVTKLKSFYNYEVKLKNAPTSPNQACKLANATGMIVLEEAVISVECLTNAYTVEGTVSGLEVESTGLTLALEDLSNGGIQRRKIKKNGDFILAGLLDGSEYNISIFSQPTKKSQTCTLSNASGTINGSAATDLSVSCITTEHALLLTVYGLYAHDSINIADSLSGLIPNYGTPIPGGTDERVIKSTYFNLFDGNEYKFGVVGVSTNGYKCQLTNPSGIADQNVTMDMRCFPGASKMSSIGGTVTGLGLEGGATSNTIKLSLNDGLEHLDVSGTNATGFTFNIDVYSLDPYSVTIAKQPYSATCTVDNNGSGTATNNIEDVLISCSTYDEPTAVFQAAVFVPNGGALDGSGSSGTSLTYAWNTASRHDFVFTNNNSVTATATTVYTDLLDDPILLDDSSCMDDPICAAEARKELLGGNPGDNPLVEFSLGLGVTDSEGHESTTSGTTSIYDSSYAYVKKLGSGNKTGASPDNAADTIQAGIAYAQANGKSRVAISQGIYEINIDNGPITMVNGVSLYGGYSGTSWNYDPNAFATVIKAKGVGVVSDITPVTPLASIVAGPDVTSSASTWIKGLHIYAPENLTNKLPTTALLINGGNITVMDNTLTGTDQGDGGWTGLTISNKSEALVRNNIIIADGAALVGDLSDARTGAGLAIYNATPIIDSNRIRGGGAVGNGILVVNSQPDIFNNMILGCEDGANKQVCFGVLYYGKLVKNEFVGSIRAPAGGKLYNNTIFGGMSLPGTGNDTGGDSLAVVLRGRKSTPEIVNNILYAQNAHSDSNFPKAACVYSDSRTPGPLPSSMYNNVCVPGPVICFHRLVVNKNKSVWEDAWDSISDSAENAGWQLGLIEEPNYSDDYVWKCRTAEQSNSDDLWQQFQDNFPYLADYIASNPELVWSGSNVDRTAPNFFVDVDGPDDDISTMDDNDWRLTVSAGDVLIEGGKCTAPDNYKDMDRGASRTPGWTAATGCQEETGYSMGAYEYDY